MKHRSITLEKVSKFMRFRNYSENTISTYISYISKYLNTFTKDVYHISVKDAKNYLENYNYTSRSQQNQIINAVKLLHREILGSKLNTLKITRPRKQKSLPRIIDGNLLKSQILSIENLKHKAILSLGFSCALRVSEVINVERA